MAQSPLTFTAASTIAPDETPTGNPIFQSSSVIFMASSLWIGTTSSTTLRSRFLGTSPAPIPWILCGPCSPIFSPPKASVISICSWGSTATVFISGLRGGHPCSSLPLMYWDIPDTVPPVPTPETNMSISPSLSRQISGPVVSLWILGFAGFSNCWSIKPLPSNPAIISFAFASAPGTAFSFGVSTTSQPSARSIILRSTLMVSGMVRMQR
mmetsp:Transcript_25764/g.34287  ORF Transcript_25764/g.34287 Transcript_25764/m.34287 type:complete len:211 (-) Transcript_25764:87-719(-)